MKAYIALIKIDLKLALRNKSVLFFNYFFPLLFFFLFGQLFNAKQGSVILQVVTMVTAIGILGNGLFGAGMRAVQERESNVLRRYKVTPITPIPLLVASMTTGLLLYLPGFLVTIALANLMYGMAIPPNFMSLLVFIVIASTAFRAIGMIVAAVVNSSQESMLLIQPLYMGMLFLSGATFPVSLFPNWLQIVTQFIPATYVMTGVGGILQQGESVGHNWKSVVALLLTAAVATFIATKLFRWEKEEKLKPGAKLWVVVALLPFVLLGCYQAWSKENVVKTKLLNRELRRGRTLLLQNARIFIGNGKVIESGSVLIKDGKIQRVFEGTAPDAKSLNAEAVEESGKTILPGLIDVHVHIGGPGGLYDEWKKFDAKASATRALEAYLYSGVTAVRSVGDPLDSTLALRGTFNSGETLGAEIYTCGPMFTVEKGHGTEYADRMPAAVRDKFQAQISRTPATVALARRQVDELAEKHVDCVKGILEGAGKFVRMQTDILKAVADEAHARHLPVAVHTGDAQDVADAVAAGANSIEHGSTRDLLGADVMEAMGAKGIAYDPTLSVFEAVDEMVHGNADLLKRSLVQQVTPKELLVSTQHQLGLPEMKAYRENLAKFPIVQEMAKKNLLSAWHAGVMLVTGSDAGNTLVMHGPTVQREVELWVEAGIPPMVALQAATLNAAKVLRTEKRMGSIEVGKEATLLVVDGNPLQDIKSLSAISSVLLKGERVSRGDIFE